MSDLSPFNVDAVPADGNLARAIERAVERQPQDRVRCVRVFGDCYRCNWWAPPPPAAARADRTITWGTDATHHVRQSRFFVATASEGRLTLTEVRE